MVVGINSLVILLLAHHAQNPAVGGLGIALVFFAASGLGSFLATLLTPPTVRRWGWPTDRLRSIAHLGVRTRDYVFVANELTPPSEPFAVQLRAPGGDVWSWGPADAAQPVTGAAEDFCFLVTHRRPLRALDLTAQGPDAQRWLEIAQAFAGPPGPDR